MLDEDLQVELFHLEIEIHEAALKDDLLQAAELRTEWFKKSLGTYDHDELIVLLGIQMRKWKEALEQALPEAVKTYTNRILLISDRLSS
jgi:hypothetical protein